MMRTIQKFILIFLFCQIGFAQQKQDSLSGLRAYFKAFKYSEVIALSKQIIDTSDKLPVKMETEILRMQGIAYYALNDLANAEKSFLNLLQIQAGFVLDPAENSPKIITFFNQIKLKYLSRKIEKPATSPPDTSAVKALAKNLHDYKSGMLRSLVLPGWGHYYVDEPFKGKLLNIATAVTLLPGIYYAIETANLEKKYLNESSRDKIETRYKTYNDAFKKRNYFLYAFSAVWLYSQYDYFFANRPTYTQNLKITPGFDLNNQTPTLRFSYKF
jgi:hypothetical protein